MVSSDRQPVQIANTLAWLEDNLREAKSQAARLGRQVEQTSAQLNETASRLEGAEAASTGLAAQLGVLPHLESSLSALYDRTAQAEERITAIQARLAEMSRQQLLDNEHVRSALNELAKRVEAWDRLIQGWAPRFDFLDDATRRTQETSSALRQRVDEIARTVDTTEQRNTRTQDALKRVDGEFGGLIVSIEALQKEDAASAERHHAHAEMVKHLEEQIAAVSRQAGGKEDIYERLELQRVGLHRADERLGSLESDRTGFAGRLEDQQRAFALLTNRDKSFREQIALLRDDLALQRTRTDGQFQKEQRLLEKQKRRRIEDLEREIRELKVDGYRSPEE